MSFGDTEYPTPVCVHCNQPVEDYYMVKDAIWIAMTDTAQEYDGQMHWACLSERLAKHGRTLSPDDLTGAPLNEKFRVYMRWDAP